MEEILASIRRIISEDEPPPSEPGFEIPPEAQAEKPAAPAMRFGADEGDDVLELTERVIEPPVESIGDLDLYPPADARPKSDMGEPLAPIPEGAPLVSEPIAAETAQVFGRLAQHVLMPREGRTLEDVVREMLNPLLKAWLDEHLPAIVQAKVEEEVERIARRSIG
jgi:cell pole-organizing protein PopZ